MCPFRAACKIVRLVENPAKHLFLNQLGGRATPILPLQKIAAKLPNWLLATVASAASETARSDATRIRSFVTFRTFLRENRKNENFSFHRVFTRLGTVLGVFAHLCKFQITY